MKTSRKATTKQTKAHQRKPDLQIEARAKAILDVASALSGRSDRKPTELTVTVACAAAVCEALNEIAQHLDSLDSRQSRDELLPVDE